MGVGVFQVRKSALFGAKTSDFLKFMVCPTNKGERGWASADILWTGREWVNFSRFCADVLLCTTPYNLTVGRGSTACFSNALNWWWPVAYVGFLNGVGVWRCLRAEPPAAGGHWGFGGFAAGGKGVWEQGPSAGRFLQFFNINSITYFYAHFGQNRYFKAITYQLKAFKISLNVLNSINEVQVLYYSF